MALIEGLVSKALKTCNMASWRVVKSNGFDIRPSRLVDPKEKCRRTRNRIAKVRKVSVNQSQGPFNASNRSFEGFHERHITLRVNVHKKYTKGPLDMKGANNVRLKFPKGKLSIAVKERVGVQQVTMNS